MANPNVRDRIAFAHVREVNPAGWKDLVPQSPLRTPVGEKAKLLIRRIDGEEQVWVLLTGATYNVIDQTVFIVGDVAPPVPSL